MLKVSWRSAVTYRGRMVLTFISVVLGTAFISGSLLLTNAMERSFDSIIDAGVDGVDIGLVGSSTSQQGVPFEVIAEIQSWPEVRAINIVGDGPGTPGGIRAAGNSGIIVIPPNGIPMQAGSSGAHPAAVYPEDQVVGPSPELIAGELPRKGYEVLLNSSAADRAHVSVGEWLQVITPREHLRVKVSGIFDSSRDTAGWISVMFTSDRYLQLFTELDHASQVVISTQPGVDPMVVRNRIGLAWRDLTPLLPEQIVEHISGAVLQQMEFVRYVLVIFGAVALLVGAFNITNTFAMVVGQRTREFALLRSIGVSTVQVAYSVLTEAFLVGLVGSFVGISAAFIFVAGLLAAFNYVGGELASIDFTWTNEAIALPLAFGVIITMASALAPARRAGMLPPVQAFDLSDARRTRAPRLRLLIAGVLMSLGAVLVAGSALINSVNEVAPDVEQRLAFTGIGVVIVFLAIPLIGPTLVVAAGQTLGRALTVPLGAVGTLARRNAVRNPRRSASSALALALGVGLVACVGTIGATTRASVFGMLESNVSVPVVLDSLGGNNFSTQAGTSTLGLPEQTTSLVMATPGVARAGTLMSAPLQVDNWDNLTTTVVDDDFSQYIDVGLISGSMNNALEGAAISAEYASQADLGVGDLIGINAFQGDFYTEMFIPITGVYTDYSTLGHITVSLAAAAKVLDNLDSSLHRQAIFVTGDGSVSDAQLRDNLAAATASLLVVQVKTKAEYGNTLGTQINQLLLIIYALLALAVIIATLGIINTLLLSVAERTRELGMLRAVGVQRHQLRKIIQIESLIISIHGAAVGIVLGTAAGWSAVRVLGSKGMASPEIPWVQIMIMVAASVLVGVIAALIPAIKASRTPPLEAIER
ncbi:ABC transporter permease [Corynebacterium atrinae]